MSESKDKELSLDELKDASGGVVHPEFRKAVVHPEFLDGKATGFSELSDISRNLTGIKENEMKDESIWPDCEDRPPKL